LKQRTALNQSIGSVKFLALVISAMLIISFKYPNRYTIALLVIFVLYCLMDVLNIHRIKRRAAQDPAFLEQKLK